MKYFQMTAYTPYCGEELTSYEMAESEEELYTSGKADALIDVTAVVFQLGFTCTASCTAAACAATALTGKACAHTA